MYIFIKILLTESKKPKIVRHSERKSIAKYNLRVSPYFKEVKGAHYLCK